MIAASPSVPFILLDDARVDGASPTRLYTNPVRVIEATHFDGVESALDQVAEAARDGHDAGHHRRVYRPPLFRR